MDAPTRVMKAFNHEEPDRVPAFENAFDSNTIKKYFKVKMGGETAVKALQGPPSSKLVSAASLMHHEYVTPTVPTPSSF